MVNWQWPWAYVFVDHASAQRIADQLESGTFWFGAVPPVLKGWAGRLQYFFTITHGSFARAMRSADGGRGVVMFMYAPFGIPIWYAFSPQ
jgi:hypothetical protein